MFLGRPCPEFWDVKLFAVPIFMTGCPVFWDVQRFCDRYDVLKYVTSLYYHRGDRPRPIQVARSAPVRGAVIAGAPSLDSHSRSIRSPCTRSASAISAQRTDERLPQMPAPETVMKEMRRWSDHALQISETVPWQCRPAALREALPHLRLANLVSHARH